MPATDFEKMDALRTRWTDCLVRVHPGRPELTRFAGQVGRVITVNYSGRALVDFADGGWYDIPATEEFLLVLPADDPSRAKYDSSVNSAQALPTRQG